MDEPYHFHWSRRGEQHYDIYLHASLYWNCGVRGHDEELDCIRVSDTILLGIGRRVSARTLPEAVEAKLLKSSYDEYPKLRLKNFRKPELVHQIIFKRWLQEIRQGAMDFNLSGVTDKQVFDLVTISKEDKPIDAGQEAFDEVFSFIVNALQKRLNDLDDKTITRFLPLLGYATDNGLITPTPKLLAKML